jgi:1,4-alpha-glucan branching enzyme
MIEKKKVRGTDKTAVTFRAPNQDDASTVHVLGDFNDWSPQHAMKRRKDGSWSLTIRLPTDQRYRFRYLVDGVLWVTDPEGDAIEPNEFGTTNGVVET